MTQELGQVIRHADTKASLLLTAQAAVIGPLTSFVVPFLRTGFSTNDWIDVILASAPIVLAASVALLSAWVILPRTRGASRGNRFAWPQLKDMADGELDAIPSALSAWQHAKVLANICSRKFYWVRCALMLAAIEVGAVLLATAVWESAGA